MNIQKEIHDLEFRAKQAGMTMADVCEKAGIHYQTYQAWKNKGAIPRLDKWNAFINAAPLSGEG